MANFKNGVSSTTEKGTSQENQQESIRIKRSALIRTSLQITSSLLEYEAATGSRNTAENIPSLQSRSMAAEIAEFVQSVTKVDMEGLQISDDVRINREENFKVFLIQKLIKKIQNFYDEMTEKHQKRQQKNISEISASAGHMEDSPSLLFYQTKSSSTQTDSRTKLFSPHTHSSRRASHSSSDLNQYEIKNNDKENLKKLEKNNKTLELVKKPAKKIIIQSGDVSLKNVYGDSSLKIRLSDKTYKNSQNQDTIFYKKKDHQLSNVIATAEQKDFIMISENFDAANRLVMSGEVGFKVYTMDEAFLLKDDLKIVDTNQEGVVQKNDQIEGKGITKIIKLTSGLTALIQSQRIQFYQDCDCFENLQTQHPEFSIKFDYEFGTVDSMLCLDNDHLAILYKFYEFSSGRKIDNNYISYSELIIRFKVELRVYQGSRMMQKLKIVASERSIFLQSKFLEKILREVREDPRSFEDFSSTCYKLKRGKLRTYDILSNGEFRAKKINFKFFDNFRALLKKGPLGRVLALQFVEGESMSRFWLLEFDAIASRCSVRSKISDLGREWIDFELGSHMLEQKTSFEAAQAPKVLEIVTFESGGVFKVLSLIEVHKDGESNTRDLSSKVISNYNLPDDRILVIGSDGLGSRLKIFFGYQNFFVTKKREEKLSSCCPWEFYEINYFGFN